jgi:hypothetical protein
MDVPKQDYEAILQECAGRCSKVGAVLERAQRNRAALLAKYATGQRLRGLNEILDYLAAAEVAYGNAGPLQQIRFLVARATGNMEVALEALLAVEPTIVCDAMRDLMEMELLLDDFLHDPSAIGTWLTLDKKARRKRFDPVKLRERFAARVGEDPKALGVSACYAIHSELLHVTPLVSPFGRGVVEGAHPFDIEICFAEIFEHARRTVYAIYRLAEKLAPTNHDLKHPGTNLPEASNAWISTEAMLGFILALQTEGRRRAGHPDWEEGYDTEHLSIPAGVGMTMYREAFKLLAENEIASDSGEPIPKGELLQDAIPIVLKAASETVSNWLPDKR